MCVCVSMYIYMSFLYVCICINMYKQLNNKCVATTHPVHKTFWGFDHLTF